MNFSFKMARTLFLKSACPQDEIVGDSVSKETSSCFAALVRKWTDIVASYISWRLFLWSWNFSSWSQSLVLLVICVLSSLT